MTLAESPAPCHVRLVGIQVDAGVRMRLRELGMHDGATLRVWKRSVFGGRVVVVAGSRIAIDAATAGCVEVEVLAGDGSCPGDVPAGAARLLAAAS